MQNHPLADPSSRVGESSVLSIPVRTLLLSRYIYTLLWASLWISTSCLTQAADPLRVFIRGGIKTHGPNQHDHPRFLGEFTKLLNERGVRADGGMQFPTFEQLDHTDVLVIFAADGMKIQGADRAHFEGFLKRGGGLVVIHDGVVADDQHDWCKSIIGGTWIWEKKAPGRRQTRWIEGEVGLYFVDEQHPITRGISNFDWKDEVYNEMEMLPEVQVLATSFVDVFNIWPQLWTYERTMPGGTSPYRAFVSLPGHEYSSFQTPHYRAILMRGIAWAAKKSNADEFCTAEELASLRYPVGGPRKGLDAVRELDLHPEFKVSLTADENVAEKIMSLDWDPQGRLWVVETPEYPGGRDIHKNDAKVTPWRNLDPAKYPVGGKEPRSPRDRVSMLEDTNGDGVMDKKTVFADGLELPTSLVFYRDGVIVSQAPDILWIRDTDGDGHADKTEVLYTGWGTFDTHAVINNLRWGFDGWIYGTLGYTKGDVKKGDGSKIFGRITDGAFRFRPDGSMVEQVSANACNTWGLEVAPDNEIIYTTATCGNPILHVVMPEKALARGNVGGVSAWASIIDENKIYPPFIEKRQPYVQIDWVNAWTAAAGACIYDGGAWPAKWSPEDRYSFFMSETTMHIFHHEFLDPSGATYKGRKEEGRREIEFMTSKDYWFRPIHSRVGPDGAMYVVDFYNQIAVHNDTRGPVHGARNAASRPDRDHHFTRVYRVQHKDAKRLPAYQFNVNEPSSLVGMLEHPNGWVRMTANRLLTEKPERLNVVSGELGQLISNGEALSYARIHALWLYNSLVQKFDAPWDEDVTRQLFNDANPAIRKNVVRLVAELKGNTRLRADVDPQPVMQELLIAKMSDSNQRVRLNALVAAGSIPASKPVAAAVVRAWPDLKDGWSQSAAVGAASTDPLMYLEATFAVKDLEFMVTYVPHLAKLIADRKDAVLASSAVRLVASQPANADALKAAFMENLNAQLAAEVKPSLDSDLLAALRQLLASDRAAGSTLPVVARWNAAEILSAEMKPAVGKATASLLDGSLPDAQRGTVAANLVGLHKLDAGILPKVASLLGQTDVSVALQKQVVQALGSQAEGGLEIVKSFSRLGSELVEPAFSQVLKRSDSTMAFLELLSNRTVTVSSIGPARLHRIKTHGDPAVARKAEEVLAQWVGPEQKEKNALIAKLTPEVVKPGNVENGKKLFTANCANCHAFKGEGRNLAPNLTGMGAHGPADLLIHIVDPNRLVEPNFISVHVETKAGDSFDGIVDRENVSEVVLRDASADHTIRVSDIAVRKNTGRSLMPEGFEALGGDGLRDLLSYLCADENKFRILDLTGVFTVNSSRGMYFSPDHVNETVKFNRYGLRRSQDVPFDVVSPDKVVANAIGLKGGTPDAWSKKSLPQRVELKVGVAASKLHFLGAVAGWGWPAVSDKELKVVKVTLHFADGATQEMVFKNGVEIADFNGIHDVPGSKLLNWTVGIGQVRQITKDVKSKAVIERMELESYDNAVAPSFFAITAEL